MSAEHSKPQSRGGLELIVAYLAALTLCVMVGLTLHNHAPVLVLAAAWLTALCVVFAFGRHHDNSSFYGPYWSLAPLATAIFLVGSGQQDLPPSPLDRASVVLFLVGVWSCRLTHNWWRRWPGLVDEDWRYTEIRERSREAFPLTCFLGIHFIPSVILFAACLPLGWALSSGTRTLGGLDLVAGIVTSAAIALEAVADNQLHAFRNSDGAPGRILGRGVWAYSRHPNYFAEACFWWGLFLFALAAAGADAGVTIAGPISVSLMLWFISIPWMDRRSVERRRAYSFHIERVSSFVPWFPRQPAKVGNDSDAKPTR